VNFPIKKNYKKWTSINVLDKIFFHCIAIYFICFWSLLVSVHLYLV
jgi:hypothetical protein